MKQSTNKFVLSSIALAVLALANQAHAQSATSPAAPTAADSGDVESQNRVVVVGTTSLKRTERESSVAVTVADREDLDRKAPRSMASALELIPGVIVEDSGGEASNNFTVRGLPGGGQNFIQISEDGLPVFYSAGFADQLVKMDLSIDRLEAVRGGTSGILTTNGAGATVNFVTYKAKDEPEGMVRLTGSDYGTKRIDLRYGGALGNGWYAGFSGFMRTSDGVRNPGYTADHGGVVRAYIGRKLSDGEFSMNVKVVDDHNMFLVSTPFMNPSDPKAVPGFDGNYGTMVSRDNAIQQGHASSGLKDNDATDGIHTKATSIGYDFNKLVGTDLTLRAKGRYTDFNNQFNAIFSYDNASLRSAADRLDPIKNTDVAAMLARFPGTTAGIRGVSSGTIYSGATLANVGGNGLVADSINSSQLHAKQNMTNDISLTWTRPNNSLTGGLLMIHQDSQDSSDGNLQFLGEVRNQPSRLDIVALNAAGQVVGQLTDKGVVSYNPWGVGTSKEQLDSTNVYFNDEYKLNDRLRLDAGVRFERLKVNQWNPNGKTITVPGALKADGTDADRWRQLPGQRLPGRLRALVAQLPGARRRRADQDHLRGTGCALHDERLLGLGDLFPHDLQQLQLQPPLRQRQRRHQGPRRHRRQRPGVRHALAPGALCRAACGRRVPESERALRQRERSVGVEGRHVDPGRQAGALAGSQLQHHPGLPAAW
jgi:outer membrane receptor protein involved in Fe transport